MNRIIRTLLSTLDTSHGRKQGGKTVALYLNREDGNVYALEASDGTGEYEQKKEHVALVTTRIVGGHRRMLLSTIEGEQKPTIAEVDKITAAIEKGYAGKSLAGATAGATFTHFAKTKNGWERARNVLDIASGTCMDTKGNVMQFDFALTPDGTILNISDEDETIVFGDETIAHALMGKLFISRDIEAAPGYMVYAFSATPRNTKTVYVSFRKEDDGRIVATLEAEITAPDDRVIIGSPIGRKDVVAYITRPEVDNPNLVRVEYAATTDLVTAINKAAGRQTTTATATTAA